MGVYCCQWEIIESNKMSRSKETKGFSFDMPADHYDLLTKYAKEKDIRIAQILRQLVRNFIEENIQR